MLGIARREREAWVGAFEFLQMHASAGAAGDAARSPAPVQANPNLVDVRSLNDIDLRMLKESLRMARRLQQRIELDYRR